MPYGCIIFPAFIVGAGIAAFVAVLALFLFF